MGTTDLAQTASERFDALDVTSSERAFLIGYMAQGAPDLAMEALDALEKQRAGRAAAEICGEEADQ